MKAKALLFSCLILHVLARSLVAGDERRLTSGFHTTAETASVEVKISIDSGASPINCPLRIEITNLGSETLHLWKLNGVPDVLLKIKDHEGRLCSYTLIGERAAENRMGSMQHLDILPSETLKLEIPLEKRFVLTPGKWYLNCKVTLLTADYEEESVRLPRLEFSF